MFQRNHLTEREVLHLVSSSVFASSKVLRGNALLSILIAPVQQPLFSSYIKLMFGKYFSESYHQSSWKPIISPPSQMTPLYNRSNHSLA